MNLEPVSFPWFVCHLHAMRLHVQQVGGKTAIGRCDREAGYEVSGVPPRRIALGPCFSMMVSMAARAWRLR